MNVHLSMHPFSFIFLITLPNAHTCSNQSSTRPVKVEHVTSTTEEKATATILAQEAQHATHINDLHSNDPNKKTDHTEPSLSTAKANTIPPTLEQTINLAVEPERANSTPAPSGPKHGNSKTKNQTAENKQNRSKNFLQKWKEKIINIFTRSSSSQKRHPFSRVATLRKKRKKCDKKPFLPLP